MCNHVENVLSNIKHLIFSNLQLLNIILLLFLLSFCILALRRISIIFFLTLVIRLVFLFLYNLVVLKIFNSFEFLLRFTVAFFVSTLNFFNRHLFILGNSSQHSRLRFFFLFFVAFRFMVIFIVVGFVILIRVFFDNSLLTIFFKISWIWCVFWFNSVTFFSSALAWGVSLFWNFIWGSTSLPFQLTSLAIWFWYSTQRCPLSAFILLRLIIISAIITRLTLIHAHYSLIRLVYRLLLLRSIWCSSKFLRLIHFLSNQFVRRAQNWLIFHWLLWGSSDCFKNIFLTRFLNFLCFWSYSGSWRLLYFGCVLTKELL